MVSCFLNGTRSKAHSISLRIFLWVSTTAFGRDSLPEVKSITASSCDFGRRKSNFFRSAMIFVVRVRSLIMSSINTIFHSNWASHGVCIFSKNFRLVRMVSSPAKFIQCVKDFSQTVQLSITGSFPER